jgi:type IV pilus assembly protein PilC
MPSFTYVGRDVATGREIKASIDASSEQAATAALLNRNMLVVSISEKTVKKGRTGGSVSLQDQVVFTRMLATMIDAGLAMVQSLQALAEQTSNKVMKDVIKDVCTRVEGGDNFSDALRKHPKVFDRLYCSMVDAGEKGGLLAEILARVATFLENRERMNKKIKSAMMYPTVVTCVAISITIFLIIKVVPVFADIFSGFGAKLPGPTQFLIDLSNFLQSRYGILIFAAIGGTIYSWFAFIKTKNGREFWDRTRIKLPVFGVIAHKIVLARTTRTLASLIRSGVPILDVLNIVANTSGHCGMERAIRTASADIEKGEGISSALGKHPIFPTMIIRMMIAGEQTGKMDEMLERVANFLDEEIETILSGLTSLIEPLLIVFLGVMVGGIVIAMFLPIFKMSDIINPPAPPRGG